MQSLVKAADSKNVPVSPYMRAFAAGAASSQIQNQQQQTLDEVKKKAEQLQSAPPQTPAPPPPAPPGPEAAIPMANLQKIIDQARGLRASAGVKLPYSHIFDPKSGTIVEAA
jgi:hypothetical protein